MTNYDRINVIKFQQNKQNGYLCSMCGQYVSLKESSSHKGYNLVCNKCEWKMSSILDLDLCDTLNFIHKKGKKTCGERGVDYEKI